MRFIARQEGNWVTLEIQDNGNGLSPEIIFRIFELRFTTKLDKQQEHGIGLAEVKGKIEVWGGTIEASSEGIDKGEGIGKGAAFTIRLHAAEVNKAGVSSALSSSIIGKTETSSQRIAKTVGALMTTSSSVTHAKGADKLLSEEAKHRFVLSLSGSLIVANPESASQPTSSSPAEERKTKFDEFTDEFAREIRKRKQFAIADWIEDNHLTLKIFIEHSS